jgi:hypothetical protein
MQRMRHAEQQPATRADRVLFTHLAQSSVVPELPIKMHATEVSARKEGVSGMPHGSWSRTLALSRGPISASFRCFFSFNHDPVALQRKH